MTKFDAYRTVSTLLPSDEQAARQGTPPPAGLPHPARGDIELPAVLHALSDPVRLLIVKALADGREWTCNSLELPVSKSTCTHHFRVLREAGVIRQRVEGTTKLNSLRREDLNARCPGLIDAVLGATSAV
jgi:DNA-binding transcriptional ArsR family regulator